MTPQVGDLRTITQRFDGEQWVNCLQSMPPRELSDEEITEVLNDENIAEYHQGNWLVLPYAFARAILRKAQEKC